MSNVSNDHPGLCMTLENQRHLLSEAFIQLDMRKISNQIKTIKNESHLKMYAKCAEMLASLRKEKSVLELLHFAELIKNSETDKKHTDFY